MDPAGELSQLGERSVQLLDRRVQDAERARVVGDARTEHLQLEGECDEVLLRALVEVALEPAPGLHAGFDDPGTRRPELLDTGPKRHLDTLVLEGGGRLCGRGPDEFRRRPQVGVVDDCCDPPTVALDVGPGAAGVDLGQLDREPALVDELLAFGEPVRDRERLVADALHERLPHAAALRRARVEQPPLDGAERPREAVEHRDRDDRRCERKRGEHPACDRPEDPRTEVALAPSPQSLGSADRERDRECDRGQRDDRRSERRDQA